MRTIIVPFKGFLNSRLKRPWTFMKFAKRRRLNISLQEEVGAHVIALDSLKRKLLLANTTRNTSSCLIIDINKLEACSIKKEYSSIHAGELKTKKLDHFLKRVFLNLVFKNDAGSLSLSLFDAKKERPGNMVQLEARAKNWQRIISKLLPVYNTGHKNLVA